MQAAFIYCVISVINRQAAFKSSLQTISLHSAPMTTIAQAIAQSPLPRLETRLLLQHITGLSHSQLITRDGDLLPPEQEAQWRQLCQRREQGEPVAYLLGRREFYGRTFAVNRHVLIPRPETEHLLEAALCRLPAGGALWDMGTGSGIIAVSAKLERPDADVFASDISADALAVAQYNAQTLKAACTFAQGSWFEAQKQPALRFPHRAGYFCVVRRHMSSVKAAPVLLGRGRPNRAAFRSGGSRVA